MPPLKIVRASPTLQIACPGIGYKLSCSVSSHDSRKKSCKSYPDVLPLARAGHHHLEPAETVMQERLQTTMSANPPPRTHRRGDIPEIRSRCVRRSRLVPWSCRSGAAGS